MSLPIFGSITPASLPDGKWIQSIIFQFAMWIGGRRLVLPNSNFFLSQMLLSTVMCEKVFAVFPKLLTITSSHMTQGYHPMPHEVEIAHTKKLFRRRRNDRR